MERTFQVNNILNKLVKRLEVPIIERGTTDPDFIESQKWFNSLSPTKRKKLLFEIANHQVLYIRDMMALGKDIGLEGLGKIKFCSSKVRFFEEVDKELAARGETRLKDVSKDTKQEIVNTAQAIVGKEMVQKYFAKLDKRNNPPTPIPFNIVPKSKLP
jgi:hypothetical protein